MKILKIYWRTTFLIIIILCLSLLNVNKVVPSEIHFYKHFDKFVHFIMYLTLSFVFFIENYQNKNSLRKIWIIFDTIFLGIIIEFAQYLLTNYRSGNIYDAIFNIFGVVVGSLFFYFLKNNQIIYKLMLFKTT